jgi:hypothetical protein
MNVILLKFVLKVFIIVFLFVSFILFINSIRLNLLQLNTIEGYETMPETNIILDNKDAFCESHRGSSNILEESCGKLTKRNCLETSCCVFTSEDKCVAGSEGGPTFNSDSNGKTKNLDYYYYKEKCFGPKCSN